MSEEKSFQNRPTPAFRFGESSETLHYIKQMLVRGNSFEICEHIEAGQRTFLLTMHAASVPYSFLFQCARVTESIFGTYIFAHQPVIALSVRSRATEILNETLDAGFSVFLLAETASDGSVTGCFTLLAHIVDNS